MSKLEKFREEDAAGYSINVVGRNTYVTEAMKKHAWDKLDKIERYHAHPMHITISLDIQKMEHVASIIAKFEHFPVNVQASSTDMYVSIDKAVERLETQLRRWKSKIDNHHLKKLSAVDVEIAVLGRPYTEVEEINAEIEAENRRKQQEILTLPKIIGKESMRLKTLTTDEALMKIDLSGEHFLIYRDEVDLKLKVMYERPDGNYGIVQVE